MASLTEVHDASEIEIVCQCGATLIGVNNLNLQNLQLQEKGYSGLLIGTSFMKSGNPGQALRNFLQ